MQSAHEIGLRERDWLLGMVGMVMDDDEGDGLDELVTSGTKVACSVISS